MPNHITNILTIEGPIERVKEIYKKISPGPTEEELKALPKDEESGEIFKPASPHEYAKRREGLKEIDFNKIVPMPSNIFRGDIGSEEEERYGRDNWYDWSISNWGTKWNAYDMYVINDYSMGFNTAWSPPEPVIRALSKMFPDVTVKIQWADEDFGSNCGEIHYKGGEEEYVNVPENLSKEAYELAFSLLGGEEDYRYDEAEGTYVYIENESRSSVGHAVHDLKERFDKLVETNELRK